MGNANNEILNNRGVYNPKVATSSVNSEENFYHNRLPENDQITNMNSGNNGNMSYNNSNSNSSISNSRGDYDPSGRNYNNNNSNNNNSNNNNPAPNSMMGIGNPNFNANNTEKTWIQIAREKASNVGANVSAGAIGLSNGSSNPTKWLSNISTQRYKQSADDGRGSNLISSTSTGGGNKMHSEEGQYTTQGIGNNNSSNSSSSSSNGDNYSNKYAQNSSSAYTPYSPGTAPSYASSSSPSSSSSSAFVRRSTADMNMLNNRQFESSSGPESYGIPGQTTTFGLSSGSTPTGGLIKPMVSAIGKGGSAASDGEYERALVTSLCEPGGLKAVPTESSINTFHKKIVNLSANLIGDSLVEQFNSDHWQSRNKALSVVESFCNPIGQNGEICTGLDDHVAWWRTVESMCTLQSMTSDSKASVRSQALKTLNAIVLYKSATPTSSSLSSSPISITANHTGSTGGSAVDNGCTNNQPVSLLDNDSYSSTSVVEDDVEVEVEVSIEESLINMDDLEPQIPVLSYNQQQQQQQRNVSPVYQQKSSYQNNLVQPNEDFLQKERDEIALLLDMDDEYNERKNSHINKNNDHTRTAQNMQNINTVEEISIFGQMTVNKQQNISNLSPNNSQNAYADMMSSVNHDYGILDLADSMNNNNSKSAATNNQYEKKNIEIDMFAGLNLSSKPLLENHHLQQSFSSTSISLSLSPSSSSSSSSSLSYTVPGSNPLPSSSFKTLLNPTDNFAFLSSNMTQSQSQSQSQLLPHSHSQFSQPLISTLQTPPNQIFNTTNNISSHGTNTNNTMNGIGTGFGLTPLSPLSTPLNYTNTITQHNTQYTSTSPSSANDSMPIPIFPSTTGLNLNNGTKPLQVPFFLQSNPGTTVTSSSLGINGINKVQDPSHSYIQNKNNINIMNKNYDSVGLNNCNSGLNNGNNGQYFVQQNQNQQGDDRMQNTNSNRMSGHINGTPGMMNTLKISRDTQNAISTSFSTSTSPPTQPTLKDDSFSFLSDVLKNPNSVPVPQTRK